jgi:hypothetical protein
MKTCIVSLESLSPYAQSRYHNSPALEGEQADAKEERTWKSKAHVDSSGMIFIPQMAFAGCIKEAAKFLNKKIPGKRNETWTKHFESGVLVLNPMPLNMNINDVRKHAVHASADGTPGGKKRVLRFFPTIDTWKGTVEFTILDDMITKEIFSEVIDVAGNLIGLGAFRVRNRGYFGRFKVVNIKWK